MSDSALETVLVNITERTMTLISDEGEERKVQWKHDSEGAEGFAETVSKVQALVGYDAIQVIL